MAGWSNDQDQLLLIGQTEYDLFHHLYMTEIDPVSGTLHMLNISQPVENVQQNIPIMK
jgi:hypothetical protein